MITTSVTEAAQCLKQGQVLAYPTEAVWGLGCDPYNEQAFLDILQIKQRPIEKGVILLAGQIAQVEPLLEHLDPHIRQQVIESWSDRSPSERATTWLLPANEHIPTWIKGNHPKVAVRVTTHPICGALQCLSRLYCLNQCQPRWIATCPFTTRCQSLFCPTGELSEW